MPRLNFRITAPKWLIAISGYDRYELAGDSGWAGIDFLKLQILGQTLGRAYKTSP